MNYVQLEINPNYEKAKASHEKYQPILQGYLMDVSEELSINGRRSAVIICPGGAYRSRSYREADPVAMRFLAAGMQTFILQYSVAPSRFPCALLELAEAVAMVRRNAHEWGIDPDKIFICGFSAGGHLCASLGTMWKDKIFADIYVENSKIHRPNGMILSYPVITSGEFTHQESCRMLLGDSAKKEELDRISLENQVDEDTVPAFIWHTQEDVAVPVENTLLFVCALRRYRIPFELHIYEQGPHGISLCDETTAGSSEHIVADNQGWIGQAVKWLKRDHKGSSSFL